jgi:hypothetical protein
MVKRPPATVSAWVHFVTLFYYRRPLVFKKKCIYFGTDFGQNYPNPFNPSTEIAYTLPEPGFVSLKVYDLLGKEIATLVNGNKPSGTHCFNFSGAGLGSGIYFYRLKAGSDTESRKMIMMK